MQLDGVSVMEIFAGALPQHIPPLLAQRHSLSMSAAGFTASAFVCGVVVVVSAGTLVAAFGVSLSFSARSALTPASAFPKMGAVGLRRGRSRSAGAALVVLVVGGVLVGAGEPVERPPILDASELAADWSAAKEVSSSARWRKVVDEPAWEGSGDWAGDVVGKRELFREDEAR